MMVDENSFPMSCVSATMQFYHWGGMGAWPRGSLGMKFPASHYPASFTMLCLPESINALLSDDDAGLPVAVCMSGSGEGVRSRSAPHDN